MNHSSESSTGIFAVGTLFSADDLIADELSALGMEVLKRRLGWVTARGTIADAYRMLLQTKCGDRVVWILQAGASESADDFRHHLSQVDWNTTIPSGVSVRVDVSGKASWLKDSRFAGQLVMDAIRDQGQEIGRPRATYDSVEPGIRIAVRFGRGQVDIGVTLNLTPLNQRGYRLEGGEAPLRETLAQIMLARLHIESKPQFILDPCCGSGTLLIEAAFRLQQRPIQGSRLSSQLSRWIGLSHIDWTGLISEAKTHEVSLTTQFIGLDIDPEACRRARANVERAGLADHIQIHEGDFCHLDPAALGLAGQTGWILANPPYGERLGAQSDLPRLYQALGDNARHFSGSQMGVITLERKLLQALRLRPDKRWDIAAGRFALTLGRFQLGEHSHDTPDTSETPPEAVIPLLNRLTKNLSKRSKLLKQHSIDCYRIYDADLPEFNVIIDRYGEYLHIQEYRPPKTIDAKRANERRQLVREWVPKHLGLPVRQAVFKERFRQTDAQYQKQETALNVDVQEASMTFEVNLTTYTDVGLFLDHRALRRWLLAESKGQRVLNLFCYTGSLSVAAAKGQARQVVSVDMSKSYLSWAQRNFEKNKLNPKHYEFIRANILEWICENPTPEFDLIVLDPPTFSNTKSSDQTLDIQRDHVSLIQQAAEWLAPGGVLYFSNNAHGFKLDQTALEQFEIQELTRASIDTDFDRSPPHVLFKLSSKVPE